MPAELAPDDLISLNRLTTAARTLVGTAHALNNALQVIAGSAELLTQQKDLGDSSRRAIDRIQQQTSRAADTLNELMQFARDTQSSEGRLAMRAIVSKAIALRAFSVRRAGLTLSFDADDAAPGTVQGRPGQLLQVVLNLIMNAEQALTGSTAGTIVITLTESIGDAGFGVNPTAAGSGVSPTAVGASFSPGGVGSGFSPSAVGSGFSRTNPRDIVTLTVADNGPGVTPDVASRLFTPFVTGHPVADAHGLGLAAARTIARQHGGDVTLDWGPDGSRATLSLPLARG